MVQPVFRSIWALSCTITLKKPCEIARNGCASIEDHGIGIPKQAHERIFEMFQRLRRPSEYPGTGIGLALVKNSLERSGGKVSMESEPGKGSRFCVQLPLAN